MMKAEVPGHDPFLICNYEGTHYVLEDGCTHALASLSEGWFDDGRVQCPLHGGAFDVKTGKAVALPCKQPVRTFKVQIRDGGVWIQPNQFAGK
jgi:nitrite reductase/ring-hydroxylating ferredoxin subunit